MKKEFKFETEKDGLPMWLGVTIAGFMLGIRFDVYNYGEWALSVYLNKTAYILGYFINEGDK